MDAKTKLQEYHDQLREELNYFGAYVVAKCIKILEETNESI